MINSDDEKDTNVPEENRKIEIEILQGDGSQLEISEVYDHLNGTKPKFDKINDKKKIIIPKNK